MHDDALKDFPLGASPIEQIFRNVSPQHIPIWFLRQNNKCLRRYRDLRERYSVLELAKNPALSASISLAPISEYGVDAAVIFSDILLPLENMGLQIFIDENNGPSISPPVRSAEDAMKLRVPDIEEITPYVFQAVQIIKSELPPNKTLIGFIGGIYTLTAFVITGAPVRDFKSQSQAKSIMFSNGPLWHNIADKLTCMMENLISAHSLHDVKIVQTFDSWVGSLSPKDYVQFVAPYAKRIHERMRLLRISAIDFSTGSGHLLNQIANLKPRGISLDWRFDIGEAQTIVGDKTVLQGNLDPERLLASWDATRTGAIDILSRMKSQNRFIFNLGHGVIQETDPENLKKLVALVKGWRQ